MTIEEENEILKGLEVEESGKKTLGVDPENYSTSITNSIHKLIHPQNKEEKVTDAESAEDELKETEIITIEIEKEFVINTGNYSSIKQRYGIKREGRTKNITSFLQQTDDIISKKVNEQFNKIKASL